jgi:hypothetical protein
MNHIGMVTGLAIAFWYVYDLRIYVTFLRTDVIGWDMLSPSGVLLVGYLLGGGSR